MSENSDTSAGLANIGPASWLRTATEELVSCKIFSVHKVTAQSDQKQASSGYFYTLNCDDWVNVVALTEDRQVVLVEQYRHGIEAMTIEIPGGTIDKTDQTPLAAAMRELKEETGCTATKWSLLGRNYPNPAIQGNFCYTYLAEDVVQVEAPKFDGTGTESLRTLFVPLWQVNDLIRNGAITHSLVIAAFNFLMLCRPDLSAAVLA
jgi:8-oxo-dGTP pyrophosphatase MutT (NUDIX family)